MTNLTLSLNALTFDELVTLGRSMIPTLAPAWTDHNVHDPGIMLIELVAWIAEAQMYSMDRLRRDERQAYAQLMGIEPHGPMPARGLIWPSADGGQNASPVSWPAATLIPAGSPLTGNRPDAPVFYTSDAVQLTTAALVRVETLFRSGIWHDWTRVNAQQTATFMPFGDTPQAGTQLILTFAINPSESPAGDAPITLGFEVVNESIEANPAIRTPALAVSLADALGERTIAVMKDTTSGLLESGVLLLPLGHVAPESGRFQLIVRSASGGFKRPPTLRRVGVNVLPVRQLQPVLDDPGSFGRGTPGQQYTLAEYGLVFEGDGHDALQVNIAENGVWFPWTRTADLEQSGPDDRHFELDPLRGVLTFGNGLNGRLIPDGAPIQVQYAVSEGSTGNVQPFVVWTVKGVAGPFGTNREATIGGQDATTLNDLQTGARIEADSGRPLVTAADVQQAARSFTDLGVKRAVELPLDAGRMTGDRVLVVTGPHDGQSSNAVLQEAPEFLEAVRSRIAPRLPVGQRLQVTGPAYVPLRITATLTAARNTDPDTVQAAAVAELQKRLAVVTANGLDQWPLGRPVSARAVQGWLRLLPGVAQVQNVQLLAGANAQPVTVLQLGQRALPSLQITASDITVNRPPEGSTR
ncbi:MAG TPA: putative baseplate assembly protein [Bryobacteraceae bacterium]|nr:putative baseplate assembly protein [Bryobacteraceae bacterium]